MRLTASHFSPWYTTELKQLTSVKKAARAKSQDLKDLNRHKDRIEFKRLRAMCIRLSRTCYRDYTTRMESNTCRNLKNVWSYVDSLK